MRPGVVGSCKNASREPGTDGSIQGPDSGFLMPSDGGEGHIFWPMVGSWDPAKVAGTFKKAPNAGIKHLAVQHLSCIHVVASLLHTDTAIAMLGSKSVDAILD